MIEGLPDPEQSRAVLIGVDSTPAHPGLEGLPAVRNNVADLAATFTDPGIWGLAPGNCVVPTDVSDARQLAATLERVAGEATDTLIVYYAGHGVPDPDDGELILAVGDMTERSPKFTGLRYAWVREAMRNAAARRLVVVLDCCFSGRALRTMSDPASLVAGQLDIDGTYVLTSSPKNSPSLAPLGARHTAFTGGLIEVLREGVVEGPERLRMSDLYEQVLRKMVLGRFPRPQQMGTNTAGRLELVRNRAWRAPSEPVRKSRPRVVVRPIDPGAFTGLADVTEAIRRTIGPGGRGDAVRITEGGPLRELTETMRRQFGDGAATAALLTGEILAEAVREISAGADPDDLVHDLQRCADELLVSLIGLAVPVRTAAEFERVLVTALGPTDIATKTAAAIERAGAANVEVGLASDDGVEVELTSRLTFTTKLLAPNAAATPVILDDPAVVLSATGQVDAARLGADPAIRGRPLLVVAPQLPPYLARRLMFAAQQVTVIFPGGANTETVLAGLAAMTGASRDGTRPGHAYRALVTASTTTVMAGNTPVNTPATAPAHPANNSADTPTPAHTGRAVVRVEPAGLPVAVRALAIARAAANGGVVAGAGAALRAVGDRLPSESPAGRVLRRALAAPHREITRNAGISPDSGTPGHTDPLNTVQGALGHAIATVVPLLAPGRTS
ncbi:caspase, EACC1-associated type [Saccharothrix deserti]|uniref:caspase, EACC1-associated type n=1 Tax=Saccharothrix deserti TaxID=2593674 RepID=UPI00131BA24A|nr:caspase family protein [Saccharothrix deserti]